MSDTVVSAPVLKTAHLFVDRIFDRPDLIAPWAFRFGRDNIVWATDGHTMFVARDPAGTGYQRKPQQLGEHPCETMPGWRHIIAKFPEKRHATTPVSINPKYHGRVIRAASILGINQIEVSMAGATNEVLYTLGPDAFAIVMPMRDAEKPHMPVWVRRLAKAVDA